jgi:hypothetical protein
VKIPHSARASTLKKQWEKAEIDKKWATSNWAKKLAAAKIRANLTDFQRFKLMRAKQAVSSNFFKRVVFSSWDREFKVVMSKNVVILTILMSMKKIFVIKIWTFKFS